MFTCQRSSVVEQRFRKPSVASSTLAAGSSCLQPNPDIAIVTMIVGLRFAIPFAISGSCPLVTFILIIAF